MSDRELLELAAKAAGYEWDKGVAEQRSGIHCAGLWIDELQATSWNPLQNDGDALRLAVQLKLTLGFGAFVVAGDEPNRAMERTKDDPHAATRRAIVRAAAEIGKAL